MRTLTDISVHGVEIQLKILQTVLPLLNNYRSVHDDILAEVNIKKIKRGYQFLFSNLHKGSFNLLSLTRFKNCCR